MSDEGRGTPLLKRLRAPLIASAALAITSVIVATAVNVGTPLPTPEPGENAAAPQNAARPEAVHQVPAQCEQREQLPTTPATDLAWSPDGTATAIATDTGGKSTVAIIRAPNWDTHVIGEGMTPRWSASGTRIAFARGDDVVIADATTGKEVARVRPAITGFGWSGDALVFWGGARLRAWSDGKIVNASAHLPDLAPMTGVRRVTFSGDGSRYAVVGANLVMYGGTADGRLSVLGHVRDLAWSTSAASALVTYDNGQRAYLDANKHYFAADGLPPVSGGWSPDGTQVLLGAAPDGPSWNLLGWNGAKTVDSTRIPSGGHSLSFSPDASYLAGIFDDGLRLYRCGADPNSGTLISRARAEQLIAQTGDLITVNLSDSKLIRWGDIAPTLTGDWAFREPAAADMRPTDPVWLLMYAGEARRPAGVKIDTEIVSPILYVLDARDGKRLAVRVAKGTWWIGQPFESLIDHAPDATAHPFESSGSNTIVMPTARPTPTLATTPGADGTVHLANESGGWALDYPDGWWSQRFFYAGAMLSARDPDFGYMTSATLPGGHEPPPSVRIEIWANNEHLELGQYADRYLYEGYERTLSRTTTTVAGRSALLLIRRQGPNPPDNAYLTSRVWVVPSVHPDRVLVITAGPIDSAYDNEVDRVIGSLALTMPQGTTRPPDISRAQVLERWTSMKTPPTRIEAKLVPYAEASAGGRGNGMQRLDRDPDGLIWIVALIPPPGTVQSFGRGLSGGPGGATPTPPKWQVYITPAYADDTGEMTWGMTSSNGDWPDFFDALKDRCC